MPDTTRRATLAALLAAPSLARAQGANTQGGDWPSQPIRYINPYPPGGSTDILSRLFCARLTELTGQQFVVENRSGSGGDVGLDAVAKSRPDGTTIGLGGIASQAISPTLKPSLPFHPERDFTFISGIWQLPNLLVVNNDSPARTVPELIAMMREAPGRFSYGSAGPGTTLHLSGAMFGQMTGAEIVHVPYRGEAPGLIDLMAGRIQMMLANFSSAIGHVREGKLRGLAVTSAERSPAAPDLPAIAEFVPGFDIVSWTCLCAPAGIPPAMLARMSDWSRQALATDSLQRAYLDLGARAWWTTPEAIKEHRRAQEAKWRPIILASGARQE
ncbi:Bug family tripartite tricarboxylate transporter substrate binding protein [Siccirubricoccus phaeus]|uniref:Bug family tripartite tricarboxylate transporter substrate binding protein n=1 Tax=Siccirubricoccus phaeus TaxID=2595053 RepID=UPI0011F30A2D|nr:tripartite tricarboxylate transporter substrate binding protein [Siccirubricoccus phaeus]